MQLAQETMLGGLCLVDNNAIKQKSNRRGQPANQELLNKKSTKRAGAVAGKLNRKTHSSHQGNIDRNHNNSPRATERQDCVTTLAWPSC